MRAGALAGRATAAGVARGAQSDEGVDGASHRNAPNEAPAPHANGWYTLVLTLSRTDGRGFARVRVKNSCVPPAASPLPQARMQDLLLTLDAGTDAAAHTIAVQYTCTVWHGRAGGKTELEQRIRPCAGAVAVKRFGKPKLGLR